LSPFDNKDHDLPCFSTPAWVCWAHDGADVEGVAVALCVNKQLAPASTPSPPATQKVIVIFLAKSDTDNWRLAPLKSLRPPPGGPASDDATPDWCTDAHKAFCALLTSKESANEQLSQLAQKLDVQATAALSNEAASRRSGLRNRPRSAASSKTAEDNPTNRRIPLGSTADVDTQVPGLGEVRSSIEKLAKQVGSLESKVDTELRELRTKVERLQTKVARLEKSVDVKGAVKDAVAKVKQELEKKVKSAEKRLGELEGDSREMKRAKHSPGSTSGQDGASAAAGAAAAASDPQNAIVTQLFSLLHDLAQRSNSPAAPMQPILFSPQPSGSYNSFASPLPQQQQSPSHLAPGQAQLVSALLQQILLPGQSHPYGTP
jgi:uncharacterized protein YoxC